MYKRQLLKGVPSSFTLELPPYRRPQIGKVVVRSIFDRTLFVLGRAVAIAAPAGLIIWILANINVGGQSILLYLTSFFDPFGPVSYTHLDVYKRQVPRPRTGPGAPRFCMKQ